MLETQAPSWYFVALVVQAFAGRIVKLTGYLLFVHLARAFLSAYNYKFGLMSDLRRGLIIVNTGPGKGKTTAAMGTALRAVGQGMRVLMLQFLKGSWHYGELDAVKAFGDKFIMKQMGRGFVKVGAEKPDAEDVRMVEEAWAEAEKAIHSGEWDLVVLDEINYAISYGMLDPAKVAESLARKPEMVHVILTGRNAHPTIVELADTVTEMRQVKHAYEKGVMAQRGIEY
jgi:cob(I)alamin adenosyltransferase